MIYKIYTTDATIVDDEDVADRSEENLKKEIATRYNVPVELSDVREDGTEWVDYGVTFTINSTPQRLRVDVITLLNNCGRTVEIFSVIDDQGKIVLTEE